MTFRYARHTNQLKAIKQFYVDVIGLEILGGFENHDGYDGVFLGVKGENWHLEFTISEDRCKHSFDEDDLVAFYPETEEAYTALSKRIEKHNIQKIKAKNPYWNQNGIVITDPDGFIVVVCNLKFT
ncbi:MAG: VOC family protein [Crocinitomicaceae bacterium]|nr:VOC family protein [Crocinitomicaceae bacterium]